ncbi:homoserine kinase [Silvanigrella paludirubra]|uniref:Homoserine kinase n=1 Tax=Silvanigrella paludirubra TaxID=2499159 RepID=A0A6N6VWU3_9BACT|nr:homoserine kinase [Silvanigrella paludirubra]KAB8040781.1 homoserine kinase [Silvanigrella paludirubra]
MIKKNLKSVSAFAPATCANVAVGFDILGFAIHNVGDIVTLKKRDDNQIIIVEISGESNIPLETSKNAASAVVKKLCDDLSISTGFSIYIQKGIAIGSGMGGSAASSVAALVALNAFLENPLSKNELAEYALFGEEIACGHKHADNIVPSLFGGMTLIQSSNPINVVTLPSLEIYNIVIHPHLRVNTKDARDALQNDLSLKLHVKQCANLASFISAIYKNDLELLKKSSEDYVVEPQRAKLIPNFYEVKQSAMDSGAISVSFSGSGPSLFAFAENEFMANKIAKNMQDKFKEYGIESDFWISNFKAQGAYIKEIIEG